MPVPTLDPAAAAELMEALTAIVLAAAAAIRNWRDRGEVRMKPDGSPVTGADRAAEAVICDGLARVASALPVIAEEQIEGTRPSIGGGSYFLVDPLDGTREFIGGLNEYTVNIALISDATPILGVIAAPALGLVWRGIVGRGAERLTFSSAQIPAAEPIHTRARPEGELIVMVSRSHIDAATQAYIASLPQTSRITCGSSLKFCRLAEGAADLYPRLGPTRDWDVASGHAILRAAGGCVIDPDGAPLKYGTAELRIPAFLAWGGPVPTEGALTSAY
jgi:3'(2'), 5'-bisphosphate nucleotidase